MSIVCLTKSAIAPVTQQWIAKIEERGVRIDAIVSELKSAWSVLAESVRACWPDANHPMAPWDRLRRIRWTCREHRRENRRSSNHRVHYVRSIDSQECAQLIADRGWQWGFLVYAPIIRRSLIEIPGFHILNAHGGLLPAYRGMSTGSYAQLARDPLGATVHLVEEAIDTGPIIARRVCDQAADVEDTQIGLLAEVLRHIQDDGRVTWVPQSRQDGRQYYRMHPTLRQMVV